MDVQQADIAYRRRVVRTLVAVAILLTIASVVFQFWLRSSVVKLDPNELATRLTLIRFTSGVLISICVAALGAHLLLRGNTIVRERRFPPRDVRSVRATPVREGDEAVRIGRTSMLVGALALTCAVLLAAWSWMAIGQS